MKNKLFSILLSCLALVAFLCACDEPVAPPPPEPVRVSVWGYQTGSLTALIGAFNDSQDKIEIDYTHFGGELYENALENVLDTPEKPDLICVKTDALPDLVDQTLLRNVDELAGSIGAQSAIGTLLNDYRYDPDGGQSPAPLWAIPIALESGTTAFGITNYSDVPDEIKVFLVYALSHRDIQIA